MKMFFASYKLLMKRDSFVVVDIWPKLQQVYTEEQSKQLFIIINY